MMIEDLSKNHKEEQIREWALHQLVLGEFDVVLSGETLDFAVNLLSQLRDRYAGGKLRVTSDSKVANETFLEFMTTKNLDRQNISMFAMLKQAGFQKEVIRRYFFGKLFPQYREKLRYTPEQIKILKNSFTKALNEVFPTLN